MKSIEALHEEALSLVPDTVNNRGVTAPPAVLHAVTPMQESPIDAPKDTSADFPPGSASDHDIMARIDHLLQKLDEDDAVTIAPLAGEGAQSNKGDMSGLVTSNPLIPQQLIIQPIPIAPFCLMRQIMPMKMMLDVDLDGTAEDTPDQPFSKTGDSAGDDVIDDTNDEIFADDQSGETAPPDQTQALSDIAAAICQARQKAIDT